MASLTLRGLNDRFPEGTSLTIRPRSNFGSSTPPVPGQAPLGSATDTQTVSGDAATFVNLTDDTAYVVTDSGGTKYLSTGTQVSHGGVVHTDSAGDVPWALLAGSVANVLDAAYGAKADAIKTTGSITASNNQLSLTTGGFTAADVGKVVLVGGAGATVNLGASNGGTAVPRPYKGWIASVAGGVATIVTAKGGSTAANATTSQTNTAVTYGTNLYDALDLALATGKPVEVPAGDYIYVGVLARAIKQLFGHGRATRIYVSNDYSQFVPDIPVGIGLTGSALALGSNATAGATSLALASAPSTISSGDVLFLSSTDIWEPSGTDNDATVTTKGELVRVQQVQGSTVYFESPIADTYLTASTAQVQKYVFADGVDVSAMRFVSATPSVYNYAASSPFTLAQYAGGLTLFTLRRMKGNRLRNVELEQISAQNIYMMNCIDFDVDGCSFEDSARLGDYGYGVSLFASQWGQVSRCRSRRSSSLINAEGVLSVVSGQATMPSRWIDVRDCIAYEGQQEAFITHVTAEFVNFIGCKVLGGAYYMTETTHSQGFRLAGRNCRAIGCLVEEVAGDAFVVTGKNCEIHNSPIRKVVANVIGHSRGILLNGSNPGAVGTIIRNADIDTVVKDPVGGLEGHGIVVLDGATGTRIIGRTELRNCDGYGVWDLDSTNSTIVDNLEALNHGVASYGPSGVTVPYVVRDEGAGSVLQYRNVRMTSPRNAATRVTNNVAAVENRYKKLTADGTFVVPDGVTKVRCRAVGAGGGGGGAGSAAAAQLQAGGGGGAGGSITELDVDVVPGETLTIDVGTGGAGGNGGAAGGNAGSNGSVGGNTTVANSLAALLIHALGGASGRSSSASSTTIGNGGLWGSNGSSSAGSAGAGTGGQGGLGSGAPILAVVGGAGGGAATATNGGGAGASQGAANYPSAQNAGGSGASGTSAGVNGSTAVMPGCGGGGGGGGAAGTGAGGAGGSGADGLVELWW